MQWNSTKPWMNLQSGKGVMAGKSVFFDLFDGLFYICSIWRLYSMPQMRLGAGNSRL